MPNPAGFIEPCLPSKADQPPSGSDWAHEIKHDGYRLMLRRDGDRIRAFTKNDHDWTDRFLAIVEAADHLKAQLFLIDGEAAVFDDDGVSHFNALRSRGREAALLAFDLLEYNGNDLRELPLSERKKQLRRLIDTAKRWRESSTSTTSRATVRRCSAMSALWGWKVPCRSGWMRRIALGRPRSGSNPRTRRARRCAGSAKRNVRPAASAVPDHPSRASARRE